MEWWYRSRKTVLRAGVGLALLVLVAWPVLAGTLTGNSVFYITLMASTLVSVMLVTSLNMAMGYSGLLSIVHTGLLALGGYTSGTLAVNFGWSPWLGIPLAVVVTAAFSALVVGVSLRASYLYFGMITLSFNLLVVEVAREWEAVTGGFFGLVAIPRPSVGADPLSLTAFYYVVLVCAVLAYAYQRNLVRSRSGRAWQAVRESDDAASALGVRVARTKLGSFTLAGALAGLAGALFAHLNSFMNPDVGLLDNALVLFIGLLLGGISTLAGPVLGVFLFAFIDQAIKDLAEYRRLILGLILLVAMVLIPRGIVGTWRASRLGKDLHEEEGDAAVTDAEPRAAEVVGGQRTEPGELVISGRGISKRFGGLVALNAVDVTVRGREIHGIIGPNGSGKSTLVSCLTRFLDADEGEVELFGQPAPRRPHQVAEQGIIRVFQVPHLFQRMPVIDNVMTGMHMRSEQSWWQAVLRLSSFRRDEGGLREEARELLAIAGLRERADWAASSLSHGQKRLLEVVRAVSAQPSVLILDEPATGLTSEEVTALGALIRSLRDRGLTIVLIEHNLGFVMGRLRHPDGAGAGRGHRGRTAGGGPG